MQPRKIALGNQKGGVGKTASTLGLASAITAVGGKVLVVDMDQQGNTTGGLGVTLEEGMMTAYHLMNQTREGIAAEAIIATPWDGVDLIPADEELGKIESDGSNDLVFRLDVAFEGLDLSPYDAVLFDCLPIWARCCSRFSSQQMALSPSPNPQSTASVVFRSSKRRSTPFVNAQTPSWRSTRS